jgi:hypothetical protein
MAVVSTIKMSYSRIAKAVQRLASGSLNGFYVWHQQENRRLNSKDRSRQTPLSPAG